MVEEEHQKLSVVSLRTTTLVQRALVHKFASLFPEPEVLQCSQVRLLNLMLDPISVDTYYFLIGSEDELLVQLEEVEPVLRPTALRIHLA
jgi:hypothetical protein